jgi:hypothetical protein
MYPNDSELSPPEKSIFTTWFYNYINFKIDHQLKRIFIYTW